MELTIKQVLQQGMNAHKDGKLQDAERLYRTILQSQPLHPDANHNLGVIAVSVNKAEAALPLFKAALEANPKIEQFWLSYIEALIKEKQFENAKEVLERARQQGVALERLNTFETQLTPIVQVKEYKPASQKKSLSFSKKRKKLTLAEAKKKKKKKKQYDIDPSNLEINNLLNLYNNRQYDDAEKLGLSLTERFPTNQFCWKILGALYQQIGKYSEALNPNQKAVALSPQDGAALSNLGITLHELGRLEEAIKRYNQSITLNPEIAEFHSNLGNSLRELGRLEEAEISYTKAVVLKPDFVEAYYNLGLIQKEMGRLGDSEVSYNQAIALKPDYSMAHTNMGNLFLDQGRLEESVSSFQKAFANRTGIRPVGDDLLAPAITSIFFELTNKCNFHCTFCPSDDQTRSLGSMDLELVKQLYEENADKKIAYEVNLHLMGEPTLHPKLIEILKFGASKNVKTDLVTNISTLVPKNVPKILDALYGKVTASHMTPTEESYHFRGKVGLSWDRYIGNLRLLVREYMKRLAKGKATKNEIVIRVMVTQNTASNVNIIGTSNEASTILKEWNDFVAEVEQELGIAPFERKDHNDDDLVRGNSQHSISYFLQQGIKLTFWRAFTFANTRVSDDFDLKTTRKTSYCTHPFTDVGVLWNGDVTLCGLDYDGELKVGNVRDSSMEALLQNDAAQKLRASMLGDYPLPSICQTCQERPVKSEKS